MGFSRQEYWSGLAISFSGGSSQPRDWTRISCIAGRFFTNWAIREARLNITRLTPYTLAGHWPSDSRQWRTNQVIPFTTSGSPHLCGRQEVQPLRLTSLVRLHLEGISQSPLRAAHCCRGWNKVSETISTLMGAHQVPDTEPEFWNKLIQSK